MALIEGCTNAEFWRPVREALKVIITGSKDALNGIAPEIRDSALELVNTFGFASEIK